MESPKTNIAPFIKTLSFTLKQLKLYSVDHPIARETLSKLENQLLDYFQDKNKVTLGAMRHRLLVDGIVISDKEVAAHDLAKEMEKLGVEGFVIQKGVVIEEIKRMMSVMSMRPRMLQEAGGFQQAFAQLDLPNISMSKGKFQLVESGEVVVEEEKVGPGGEQPSTGKKNEMDIVQIIQQIQREKNIPASNFEEGVVFNAAKTIEQIEKSPKDIVAAALAEAEDEARLEQVIRQMTKLLIEGLLTHLVAQGKDITRALEKLSKEIEKGLSQLGEGEEYVRLKEKIPGIFEEAADELRIQMVCKTYQENPDDTKKLEKIAKKLFKDKDIRERLAPALKEEAMEAGLSADTIEDIFNKIDHTETKRKSKLSVDAGELEELRRKAELYDSVVDGKLEKQMQNLELENKIIKNQKARIDSVIHNLAEGLVVVDEHGKVVLMNPAAEKLLDVKQDVKLGHEVQDGLGDQAMVTMAVGDLRGDDHTSSQQVQLMGKNEETKRVLQASSAVIENEDGQTVGMVSVLSDITRQKQLDELKTKFVSNVSHELRTPLVAIQKSLALILEREVGEVNPDQEKFLGIAHRNIDRLSRLINDLLDVQKLEASQMTTDPSVFPMNGVIDHVVSTMETWLKDKNITVKTNYPAPEIDIEADPDRLTQVLTNLLGNAVKFTPNNGEIVIDIKDHVQDEDIAGECIEVGVQDSGIGIEPDDQKKIFEKFVQVGLSQPAGVSSTGLGLTITKEIVELHNGKIWVESEPGKGSRFAFRVPKKFNPRQRKAEK